MTTKSARSRRRKPSFRSFAAEVKEFPADAVHENLVKELEAKRASAS
jgi:hypothetical protein